MLTAIVIVAVCCLLIGYLAGDYQRVQRAGEQLHRREALARAALRQEGLLADRDLPELPRLGERRRP